MAALPQVRQRRALNDLQKAFSRGELFGSLVAAEQLLRKVIRSALHKMDVPKQDALVLLLSQVQHLVNLLS